MKKGIYHSKTYIELEDGEEIRLENLRFGEETYSPGQYLEQLGSRNRTMLKMGAKMIYIGKFDGYALFDVDRQKKKGDQFNLFQTPEKRIYIAPIIVDDECLLMQSSPYGFWDIRP